MKILDFGIAKLLAAGDAVKTEQPAALAAAGESVAAASRSARPLAQAGSVFGTPEYIAPEQALGEETDARADLYSFGCVLYEMLAGQRPFQSRDKVELLAMHLTREAAPLRHVAPGAGISASLEAVVRKAMAKKRDQRFPSATAFLAALQALSAVGAVGAGPGGAVNLAVPRSGGSPGLTTINRPSTVTGLKAAPAPAPAGVAAVTAVLGEGWHWLVARIRRRPWLSLAIAAASVIVLAAIIAAAVNTSSAKPRRRISAGKAPEKQRPVDVRPRADKTPKPAPALPPPAPHPTLAQAEDLISHGKSADALPLLEKLADLAGPEQARANLLLGHLRYDTKDRKGATTAYVRAVSLDPALGDDAVMLAHLDEMSKSRATDEAALVALVAIGRPAIPELVAYASAGRVPDLRHRAAAALAKLGAADRIDRVSALQLDAVQLPKCPQRAAAEQALVATKDPRLLDMLKRLRSKRGGRFDSDPIGCFRKKLDAEIKRLERTHAEASR